MSVRETRRQFLRQSSMGAAAGAAAWGILDKLPPVSAGAARLPANMVRLDPSIEPLVRLLETSPRNRLLEAVADKIRRGTPYREVLAALLLAAVRNVEPRPSVGFKFHAVLVVNSAHLASLASPPADRWLPIFWALDYYKDKQIEEERRNGWKLPPVDEKALPRASQARQALVNSLEKWDEKAADVAVARMARSSGRNQVFEILLRYASRDYRSIGHKAIFAANARRTLSCIGWQHAEPVLRSLVYAMLNHRGEPNPSRSDLNADRPWRQNAERVLKIRADYADGKPSTAATRELVSTLRTGSAADACDLAVTQLNKGVAPQSIWDAVMVGAGELLMRQPGIIGLHGLTSANAVHFASQALQDDRSRLQLLLQNCAFVPMFRESAKSRGRLKSLSIDELKPAASKRPSTNAALEEIFADIGRNSMRAAARTRAFLSAGRDAGENAARATELIRAARRLIFLKGRDAHDYKFSSAVLEDYHHVSPEWRNLFLALSVFNLQGSGGRDNSLVERTRAALKG